MSEVADLNEAREARRMGELLSQLGEALKAADIDVNDPHDPLGRMFALVMLGFERQEASQREFRFFQATSAADLNERLLRLIEDGQAVSERYHAAARDELAKLDRMARKAEADLQRKQLAVQDSILETLERVTPRIVAGVKEASVIRARAFNRMLYARHLAAGMAMGLAVLGLTFEAGRLTKARPVVIEAPSQSDKQ